MSTVEMATPHTQTELGTPAPALQSPAAMRETGKKELISKLTDKSLELNTRKRALEGDIRARGSQMQEHASYIDKTYPDAKSRGFKRMADWLGLTQFSKDKKTLLRLGEAQQAQHKELENTHRALEENQGRVLDYLPIDAAQSGHGDAIDRFEPDTYRSFREIYGTGRSNCLLSQVFYISVKLFLPPFSKRHLI